MSYQQIASGGVFDLINLGDYENQFEEDSRGMLEVDLRLSVSEGIAQDLENLLRSAGVEGVRVTTASPMLKIYWTKGFPWLAVIAATILAFAIIAILVIGWRLFEDIGLPGGLSIGLVLGIAVLVILAYVSTREIVKEKAKKVIYG